MRKIEPNFIINRIMKLSQISKILYRTIIVDFNKSNVYYDKLLEIELLVKIDTLWRKLCI